MHVVNSAQNKSLVLSVWESERAEERKVTNRSLSDRFLITLCQLQTANHMMVFLKVKSATKEHKIGEEEQNICSDEFHPHWIARVSNPELHSIILGQRRVI
jgi:hypothetical protein